MSPQRIQLRRTKGWRLAPNARAVTRPGYYGNPYKIGSFYMLGGQMPFPIPTARMAEAELEYGLRVQRCHTAEQAVVWFREYAPHALEPEKLALLTGMDLACWCPLDQACHADVLLELANGGAS
jgi:hypothetical protein